MINADGEIIVDQTTGYSKEDAMLLLLGIKLSEEAECSGICLDDILDAEKERAEADYSNAKAEKHSDESIKTAFDNLTKADQLITKAAQYRRDITDELAKKESALRLDESNRITINSLKNWAHEVLQISILDELDISKPPKPAPRTPDQEGDISISEKSKIASHPAIPVLKNPQRRDALCIEIEDILKTAPHSTASEVMAKLRAKVGSFNTCIIGNTGEGLKWESDKGNENIIKIKALSERLRNLRKPE